MSEWNDKIIAEFRANEGRVGVTNGAERDEIWEAQKAEYTGFAGYERKTTRQIPVVVLQRAG